MTDTDMIVAWKRRDSTIAQRLDALTPLGRGAQPREIAEAAAWLLSETPGTIAAVGTRGTTIAGLDPRASPFSQLANLGPGANTESRGERDHALRGRGHGWPSSSCRRSDRQLRPAETAKRDRWYRPPSTSDLRTEQHLWIATVSPSLDSQHMVG